MKLSLSWLKEYLDTSLSAEVLSDKLTLAGLEGEGFETVGEDTIFSIGLTPNLGHCLSVRGIARELAAILETPLKKVDYSFEEQGKKTQSCIKIAINHDDCLRYGCRIVENVKVGPSPQWLVDRLESMGVRSINNVVDIGNFVMLAWGQPLHMFDLDKLEGQTISVDTLEAPFKMTTLDEEEREIPAGTLVINDGQGPVAVAGVMGDFKTAVTEKTTRVLIEAACFSPTAVRASCKALNLRSESSNRFERGIDPLSVFSSLDYAASLFESAEVLEGIVSSIKTEYTPVTIATTPFDINRLLGTTLTASEMATLLSRLDFTILKEEESKLEVEVPSFRNDVTAPIDLVEEVGRLYGLNNIPRPIPRHASSSMTHSPLYLFERKVREQMVGLGLQEWLTCDLISPKLSKLSSENAMERSVVSVLHPASVDQSILRTTLLPGMLEVVKSNIDRDQPNQAAFEVGHIHFKEKENYHSEPVVGILLTGKETPYHYANKPKSFDFFHLKGLVEGWISSLHLKVDQLTPSHLHNFHPKQQASITIQGLRVGSFGQVHPAHLRELGIEQPVFYAEFDLPDLMSLCKETITFSTPPQYPGSERDWTIVMPESVPISFIFDGIQELSSNILENCFLLDFYQSEKIGKERKSVTFRFQYRNPEKTVSFEEVEKEHLRLTESMAQKLAVM